MDIDFAYSSLLYIQLLLTRKYDVWRNRYNTIAKDRGFSIYWMAFSTEVFPLFLSLSVSSLLVMFLWKSSILLWVDVSIFSISCFPPLSHFTHSCRRKCRMIADSGNFLYSTRNIPLNWITSRGYKIRSVVLQVKRRFLNKLHRDQITK